MRYKRAPRRQTTRGRAMAAGGGRRAAPARAAFGPKTSTGLIPAAQRPPAAAAGSGIGPPPAPYPRADPRQRHAAVVAQAAQSSPEW